jgi:hypothetical protein
MNGEGFANDHIILTSHETLFGRPGWQLWRCLIRYSFLWLIRVFNGSIQHLVVLVF